MSSVIVLSVVLPSVIIPSVVAPSVVVPSVVVTFAISLQPMANAFAIRFSEMAKPVANAPHSPEGRCTECRRTECR
jgi:hypothetical protein